MFLLGIVISVEIVACCEWGYFILNTTENGYLLPLRQLPSMAVQVRRQIFEFEYFRFPKQN